MPKSGVVKKIDNVAKFLQGVEVLAKAEVLVGVPADKTSRKETGGITNAELAYIHDKGAPEANIPARPFMEPGIAAVRDEVTKLLVEAGNSVFKGAPAVLAYFTKVGIIATRSIKNQISAGIPPPLAPSTIAARIRRIKGKKRKQAIADARAAGTPDSRQSGAEGIFTPLKVTNQLFNAITYIIRGLKK